MKKKILTIKTIYPYSYSLSALKQGEAPAGRQETFSFMKKLFKTTLFKIVTFYNVDASAFVLTKSLLPI